MRVTRSKLRLGRRADVYTCVLCIPRTRGVALCDLHIAINPLRSWRSQRRGFMCQRGTLRETCKSKGKCLSYGETRLRGTDRLPVTSFRTSQYSRVHCNYDGTFITFLLTSVDTGSKLFQADARLEASGEFSLGERILSAT